MSGVERGGGCHDEGEGGTVSGVDVGGGETGCRQRPRGRELAQTPIRSRIPTRALPPPRAPPSPSFQSIFLGLFGGGWVRFSVRTGGSRSLPVVRHVSFRSPPQSSALTSRSAAIAMSMTPRRRSPSIRCARRCRFLAQTDGSRSPPSVHHVSCQIPPRNPPTTRLAAIALSMTPRRRSPSIRCARRCRFLAQTDGSRSPPSVHHVSCQIPPRNPPTARLAPSPSIRISKALGRGALALALAPSTARVAPAPSRLFTRLLPRDRPPPPPPHTRTVRWPRRRRRRRRRRRVRARVHGGALVQPRPQARSPRRWRTCPAARRSTWRPTPR